MIRQRSQGLTLLEVAVSVTLLTVIFMSFFSSLLTSQLSSAASSEDVLALECAQNQIEKMKAAPFATVFPTYYTAGGQAFTVKGLGPGATGTIKFLSEVDHAAASGKAVDLDLDGNAGGVVPSASYAYFPVQVTVTWRSRSSTHAKAAARTLTISSAIFAMPSAN